MSDILTNPVKFKAELKEKWLSYYQTNRTWLQHYMDTNKGWCDAVDKIYTEEELQSFEIDPKS